MRILLPRTSIPTGCPALTTLYGVPARATLSVREDGRPHDPPPLGDLPERFRHGKGEDVMTSPAEQLSATLRGPVYQPQDAGYEQVRPVYNAMIDRYPQVIAQCADVTDVRDA